MIDTHDLDPEGRAVAQRIASLPYHPPPPELAARVMARITARRLPFWRRWLQWLVTPRPIRIAPLAPLGAVACALLLLFVVLPDDNTAPPSTPPRVVPLQASPATSANGRVEVVFFLRAEDAREVALVGSFTNWQDQGYRLQQTGQEGLWTITLPLATGRHQYAFLLDGNRMLPDPNALLLEEDGFGNFNSVIMVDDDVQA